MLSHSDKLSLKKEVEGGYKDRERKGNNTENEETQAGSADGGSSQLGRGRKIFCLDMIKSPPSLKLLKRALTNTPHVE